ETADELLDSLALLFVEVAVWDLEPYAGPMFLEIAVPRSVLRLGPRLDRAFLHRKRRIGNHAAHIEVDGVAEGLAPRARAERRVEAEKNRLGLVELLAACLALEALVEADLLAIGGAFEDDFAGLAIADLDRVHDALAQSWSDRETIDEDEQRLREIDI